MEARQHAELKRITQEVLGDHNPYDLDPDTEMKDFKIVTNTLAYVIENIGKVGSELNRRMGLPVRDPQLCPFNCAQNMDDFAVLHLEAFKDILPKDRKAVIVGSLVTEFIECFKIVKETGHVKEFAKKMSGICIDARTRAPFEFARTLGRPPTFFQLIQKCTEELKENYTYFALFKSLLEEEWGSAYSKEMKSHYDYAIGATDGVVNSDKLPEIKDFFDKVIKLGANPEEDFLELYQSVPPPKLPIFCKFVLQHEGLIEELELKISPEKKRFFNEFIITSLICEGEIDQLSEKN